MTASTAVAPPTAPEAHARPAAEVCDEFRVDARTGLSETEAATRLAAAGPNQIRTEPAPSRLALVARQFGNSMVLLLVGAAAISLSIGEALDAGVILAIVVANAIFGAVQEGRADQAAAAVRALLAPTAHVVRDGHVRERPAEVVVPGDVVALARRVTAIPADGRFIDGTLLQVDESALTGESLARGKRVDPPEAVGGAARRTAHDGARGHDRPRGTGRAVVTATGARTEMGQIAGAAGRRRGRTPLQGRLDRLRRLLIPMAAGIIATLTLLAYLPGDTLAHSVLVGVSLARRCRPLSLMPPRQQCGTGPQPSARARRHRPPEGRKTIVRSIPDVCNQLDVLGRQPYRFPTPLACRLWSKWPGSPKMGVRLPQMSHHDDEERDRSQTPNQPQRAQRFRRSCRRRLERLLDG